MTEEIPKAQSCIAYKTSTLETLQTTRAYRICNFSRMPCHAGAVIASRTFSSHLSGTNTVHYWHACAKRVCFLIFQHCTQQTRNSAALKPSEAGKEVHRRPQDRSYVVQSRTGPTQSARASHHYSIQLFHPFRRFRSARPRPQKNNSRREDTCL